MPQGIRLLQLRRYAANSANTLGCLRSNRSQPEQCSMRLPTCWELECRRPILTTGGAPGCPLSRFLAAGARLCGRNDASASDTKADTGEWMGTEQAVPPTRAPKYPHG